MQTKHEGRPKPKCPLHLMGKCRKTFTTIGNMKVSNGYTPCPSCGNF